MNVTVALTDAQAAGVAAELADYNKQQPEDTPAVGLDEFVGMLVRSRADASVQRYGTIPVFDFVQRFPSDKYAAIKAAASSDLVIQSLFAQLADAEGGMVRLWKDSVSKGLQYLMSKGMLNAEDVASIGAIR